MTIGQAARGQRLVRRGPAMALGLALLLLLLAALDLASALRGFGRSADEVTQSYEVIGRVAGLLSAIKDAETGQRGYLLAREDRYLQPYDAGVRAVGGELAELRRLAADDPVQAARLPRLEALARDKLAELARTVTLARGGDAEGAIAVLRTGEGKAIMDALRAEVAAFAAEQRRLLADRRGAFEAAERAAVLRALAAAAAAVGAAAAAAWMLLRRGRRAEATLAATSAELEARLAQLRATYDSAPIGLSYQDADLRYVAVNERMAAINGRSVEAHVGRTPREAIPEVADAVEPLLRQVIETGEPILDVDIRTRAGPDAGEARDFLAAYWPVKEGTGGSGGTIGVNVAVLDVTERRAAEAALRELAHVLERQVALRTAELTAANEQLEAFAYTVSHDLRAPLRGMEGFARILLEDFAGPLGPQGRRYAERIVKAAERMDGLISDLLTFSRLQRAEVALRAVDPTSVARAAANDARALAPDADVAVEEPLPAVIAEPVVLGHVLANLLTNAVKFRKDGAPARVRVGGARLGDRARLWVEDDGIGIAAEHQGRIFGVFERLHGQEAYPGTGIGLAIVRAGAMRMRGSVGVESREGHGARFWVELAAANASRREGMEDGDARALDGAAGGGQRR